MPQIAVFFFFLFFCPVAPEAIAHFLLLEARINLFAVDDHPHGYPQLAAFVNSDENFLIARKYGYLRSRVLLYRQDELSVLERELVALDADDQENRPMALTSRKHDEQTDKDPVYSRKVLIQKIDDKLKEYGKHISS